MSVDSAKRFKSETKHHVMEIVHDDGLYRHLRFTNPKSDLYWFEITTTPGQLAFSGDGESFVFRLAPDMFRMFRESAARGGINPWYWSEKLKTGNGFSYSEEAFRGYIERAVAEAEGNFPGLREDVQEEILNSLIYDVSYEAPAMMAAVGYSYIAKGQEFRFRGTWEWNVKDYDWWYLFACHAIVWGIRQYDAARAAAAATPQLPRPSVAQLAAVVKEAAAAGSCWVLRSAGRAALIGVDGRGGYKFVAGFHRRTLTEALTCGLVQLADTRVAVPQYSGGGKVWEWDGGALEGRAITPTGGGR